MFFDRLMDFISITIYILAAGFILYISLGGIYYLGYLDGKKKAKKEVGYVSRYLGTN